MFRISKALLPQSEEVPISIWYVVDAGVVALFVLAGFVLLKLVYSSIFH